MHELSIAVNLVDIAISHANEAKAKKINCIEVEIGELSGVIGSALEFCFETVCKNTIADNAILSIISISALGTCQDCHHSFSLDSLFSPCPNCESFQIVLNKGKELRIKSILVEN